MANSKRRLSIDFPSEDAMRSFFFEVVEPYAYETGRDVAIYKRDTLDSKAIAPRFEYIVKAEGDRPDDFKLDHRHAIDTCMGVRNEKGENGNV